MKRDSTTQTDKLLALPGIVDLFHSPEGDAYATVEANGHQETAPIQGLKPWLRMQYWASHGRSPGAQPLKEAVGQLGAAALYSGQQHRVFHRIGEYRRAIYLDLGDPQHRVVEIGPVGYSVLDKSPVKFLRPRGIGALPIPEGDGSIDDLRPFINIESDEDFILIVSYLLACFMPRGPHPLLDLNGEQGSAKSTLARLIGMLIDPRMVQLRTPPTNIEGLMIAANNSWLLCFDNLSWLPIWFSDALCRISTGGGLTKRKLWEDIDEVLIDVRRPVMLTGIGGTAERQDLLDRGSAESPASPSGSLV